jgi:kynurenine formamidase
MSDRPNRRDVLAASGAVGAFAVAGVTPREVPADQDEPAGDLEALLSDLPDNWGRWGDDDELGAFNYLGSEQAFDGLLTAVLGGRNRIETFTLQLSMTGEVDRDPIFPTRTVARRENTQDARSYEAGDAEPLAGGLKFSDDWFLNQLYPQGSTHVDAPGHAWYGDQIYNGFDESTTAEVKAFDEPLEDCQGNVVTETRGSARASIAPVADHGIVGRGVLLDVGRAKGAAGDRLAPDACVTLADLSETAREQGVTIRKRDIPLVRTGSAARARDDDPDHEWAPLTEPGLCFSEDLVRWVHEMEFPAIGGDTLSVEKNVQVIDGEQYLVPLHGAFHRDLGMPFVEALWLEDLAERCAADGIYEFLFAGAPLNIERATGALINPVVLKATRPTDQGTDGGG